MEGNERCADTQKEREDTGNVSNLNDHAGNVQV